MREQYMRLRQMIYIIVAFCYCKNIVILIESIRDSILIVVYLRSFDIFQWYILILIHEKFSLDTAKEI